MRVIVASENPVKLAAAKRAFKTYFSDEDITFDVINGSSGVSDQPMSATETAEGAINRANNIAAKDADYIVGIEGGLSFTEVKSQIYGFEQTWACIVECQRNLNEIAAGPTFPLFSNVLRQIHSGKTLTDSMSEIYGTEDLGQNDGYNGWLSHNVIDRESSSFQAVFLALCALLKEDKQ